MARIRPFALSALLLGLLAAAPAADAQAPLTACRTVAPRAQCGTLAVPLDHSGAVPGTQRLGFAVLPATKQRFGTLAVLVGGPGQAGTTLARQIGALLAPINENFDLLLVDQRGTGRSGALTCRGLANASGLSAVRACGESLGAARAFLSTREDAFDLEDVRAALGIDRLSLFGVSYGTEIAGYYARLFPGAVDHMILDSPEPIEGPDALESLRQLALPRVLREVCWPPSCRGFLASNPITGVARLAAKLSREPLRGYVVTPSGRRKSARLTSTALYALTAVSDLDPFLRTRLPSAVAAALRGDTAPMLRLALGTPTSDVASDKEFNPIRLLATSCMESRLPWDPSAPLTGRAAALEQAVKSRPAADWAPFSPTSVISFSTAGVCLGWPSTPKPAGVAATGPNVPVLVVSGRDDLRTPLEDARRTASQYPNAQVLAVPDTGHSVLANDPTDCALTGVEAFLANQAAPKCVRKERLPDLFPYVPGQARDLRRVPGMPAREGRTATAIGATLLDAVRQAGRMAESGTRRVGGLRAGTVSASGTSLKLRGYSLVEGIAVSGTLPLTTKGTGHLIITGLAAAPGTLTIRGSRLTGRLGVDRVRLRVVLPLGAG